jgi:hypothetical protein
MGYISKISRIAFGIAIFLGLVALPFLFFAGITRASEHIIPPLISIGWICVALISSVLLPLSIFKKLRIFTGTAIYICSYIFGLLCFLISLMTTWLLWGGFWAIIGMMTLGGAVVPFALLASGFKGMWSIFFIIIGVLVVTWGARIIGMMIAENGVNHKLKQTK